LFFSSRLSSYNPDGKTRSTAANTVGIYFHGNPEEISEDGEWKNGYRLVYGFEDSFQKWSLGKIVDYNFEYITDNWVESELINPGFGADNKFKLKFTAGAIEVWINDEAVGNYTDTEFSEGYLGLTMFDTETAGIALFDEVAISTAGGFEHFSVYRDGSEIGTSGFQQFVDQLPEMGSYSYYVTATNDIGESPASNTEIVNWGVGINEIATSDLIIAPNPIADALEIKTTLQLNNIFIINTFGQIVLTSQITVNHHRLNIASLPAGIYFIRIETEKGIAIRRIIKVASY